MIIYKTITEAKKNKIISLPGIYYFKNKINNKYYLLLLNIIDIYIKIKL